MTSQPFADADLPAGGHPPTGPNAGLDPGHGPTADRVAWLARLADGLQLDPPPEPGPAPAPAVPTSLVEQLIGGPASVAPRTAPMIDQLTGVPSTGPATPPAALAFDVSADPWPGLAGPRPAPAPAAPVTDAGSGDDPVTDAIRSAEAASPTHPTTAAWADAAPAAEPTTAAWAEAASPAHPITPAWAEPVSPAEAAWAEPVSPAEAEPLVPSTHGAPAAAAEWATVARSGVRADTTYAQDPAAPTRAADPEQGSQPAAEELATLAAIATRLAGGTARRQAEGAAPGLFGVGADTTIIGLLAQAVASSARQLQLAAAAAQRAESEHFKAAMIASRRVDEVAALGRMAEALERFELVHGLGVVAAELAGLRGVELSRISVATPDHRLVEVASGASYGAHFGADSRPDQPGSPEQLALAGGELVVWRRPAAADKAVISGLAQLGLTSAFVIPLWWEDVVVGTILAGSTGGHRLVTDEHMMVAAVAADLIMEAAGHPDALYRAVARRVVGA